MDNGVLLSIAIPTYNRYQYLEGCLKATCTLNASNVEIVVQDNSENNTKGIEIIRSINDARVKYYYSKEHMTVSENCSLAIEHTTGKYVCLLGDDDTICDNISTLVQEMDNHKVDTCVFGIATYHWQDLLKLVQSLNCFERKESSGRLVLKDTMIILHNGLKNGFQFIGDMPRVYHSIASREVLDTVKEKTGSFFPGPSPDMANAVGCSLFSKKHIQLDIPVMISGYGGNSGGGMGRAHKHRGSLLNKPWLPKNIIDIWDKKIPQLWLGHTIWPVSAVTALKASKRMDLIKELNYGAIYAEILLHEIGYFKYILKCHVSLKDWCNVIFHTIKRVVNKLLKLNYKKTIVISKNAIDLVEAKKILDEQNKSFSISKAFEKLDC